MKPFPTKIQQRLTPAPSGSTLPPGQIVTEKWPVLTAGPIPQIDLDSWNLAFRGLVENPSTFTFGELQSLSRKSIVADFHCVTGWSRLGNRWEGVEFRELMELVLPLPEATHVMALCYGGYTTNLPLSVLMDEETLLAFKHNGQSLTPEHGGPVRLVVPKRYGWKSAKWVKEFDFMDEDEPGFWEVRGYHNDGDPWREERYS